MSKIPPKILAIFDGNYLGNTQAADEIALGYEFDHAGARITSLYVKDGRNADGSPHWEAIGDSCTDFDGDGQAEVYMGTYTLTPETPDHPSVVGLIGVCPADPQRIAAFKDKTSEGPTHNALKPDLKSDNYRLDINGDGTLDYAGVEFSSWPWKTVYNLKPKQVFPK